MRILVKLLVILVGLAAFVWGGTFLIEADMINNDGERWNDGPVDGLLLKGVGIWIAGLASAIWLWPGPDFGSPENRARRKRIVKEVLGYIALAVGLISIMASAIAGWAINNDGIAENDWMVALSTLVGLAIISALFFLADKPDGEKQ